MVSVHDLPDDVLITIFANFHPYHKDLIHSSRVQHRWHHLALHTPSLWSEIYGGWIVDEVVSPKIAFSRSRSAPLSCVGRYNDLASVFESARSRLTVIRIFLSAEHLNPWTELVRSGLPSLVVLRLIFKGEGPDEDTTSWAAMTEENLPSLAKFTTKFTIGDVWFKTSDLRLPKLKGLGIEMKELMVELPAVLAEFPLLEELSITLRTQETASYEPYPKEPLRKLLDRLSDLKFLEIEGDGIKGSIIHTLQAIISLPIKRISLTWYDFRSDDDGLEAVINWVQATRDAVARRLHELSRATQPDPGKWTVIISRDDIERFGHIVNPSRSIPTVTIRHEEANITRRILTATSSNYKRFASEALRAKETGGVVLHGVQAFKAFCDVLAYDSINTAPKAQSFSAIENLTLIISRHEGDSFTNVTRKRCGSAALPNLCPLQAKTVGVRLHGLRSHLPSWVQLSETIRPWTHAEGLTVGDTIDSIPIAAEEQLADSAGLEPNEFDLSWLYD
ncbi:hypothetical protein BKA62DRAFT_710912 [Auriculariales sp. MPI-PUGE-AT-0066]|nr:hypothetical protein BKA62DRAFT_710912 [Auriculariales sp. MPI-PUGE-AT-0066]